MAVRLDRGKSNGILYGSRLRKTHTDHCICYLCCFDFAFGWAIEMGLNFCLLKIQDLNNKTMKGRVRYTLEIIAEDGLSEKIFVEESKVFDDISFLPLGIENFRDLLYAYDSMASDQRKIFESRLSPLFVINKKS